MWAPATGCPLTGQGPACSEGCHSLSPSKGDGAHHPACPSPAPLPRAGLPDQVQETSQPVVEPSPRRLGAGALLARVGLPPMLQSPEACNQGPAKTGARPGSRGSRAGLRGGQPQLGPASGLSALTPPEAAHTQFSQAGVLGVGQSPGAPSLPLPAWPDSTGFGGESGGVGEASFSPKA